MRAAFDLDELPARERYTYWRDVSESLHVPVSVTCDSTEHLNVRWDGRYIGRFFVGSAFFSEEQKVSRTQRHISRSGADPIGVWVPLSGGIRMRQDGRETLVQPGQLGVVDPTRPYEEVTLTNTHFLWMHLPRPDVLAKLGTTESITGVAHVPERPYMHLAISFIRSLSGVWDELPALNADRAATNAFDLLSLAFGQYTSLSRQSGDEENAVRILQIKLFVREHLADPDLSIDTVATGLSLPAHDVRRLTSQAGFIFQRYVQERRLVQCAMALIDPRFADRSVADIACMCGLRRIDRFLKAFRVAYDVSPEEFRMAKRIKQ